MSRPPRILQVANHAGPLYLFLLPLCCALEKGGMEVELACRTEGPSYEPLTKTGFKVRPLLTQTARSMPAAYRCWWIATRKHI